MLSSTRCYANVTIILLRRLERQNVLYIENYLTAMAISQNETSIQHRLARLQIRAPYLELSLLGRNSEPPHPENAELVRKLFGEGQTGLASGSQRRCVCVWFGNKGTTSDP